MHITTDSPIYQKAFEQYLRKGTPIKISLKMLMTKAAETRENHTTTHYIWRTSGDDKVRPSHAANEGQRFAWDDPPPTGHPGEDFNCRCTAEPYVQEFLPNDPTINDPPIEPVYPEAIIPLLRIPRLIVAWRAWALQRNLSKTWKLGKHKSAQKWANRMEKGNWTPDKISETIRNGEAHNAPNNVNRPNTATRYELGNDFVVVDDVTKEVLQVSEPGYLPKEL